jgi:uncharacterized protein (TIGR02391 family)
MGDRVTTADPREFMQAVYDSFHSTGKWPLVRQLQVKFRESANVRALAVSAGVSKVVCENRTDGECFLHLEGIVECAGAEDDIENFLSSIRYMARRYVNESASRITGEEIDRDLKLPALARIRLSRILARAAGFAGNSSISQDGTIQYIELVEDTLWFEHVETFEEFIAIRRRVRDEAATVAAGLWSGPNPSAGADSDLGAFDEFEPERRRVAAPVATTVSVSDATAANFTHWPVLHDEVVRVARSLFDTQHYAEAVFAALRELNTAVKVKSGQTSGKRDGAELMTFVFSKDNPVLVFGDLATENGRNEQLGYMHIFAGAIIGIRNPKAHTNLRITPTRALQQLFLASLLFSRLDECTLRAAAVDPASIDREA